MVVHAQVAREPDDGGHAKGTERLAYGRWRRPSSASRSFRSASCCIPHELVPLHIFEERYKLMIGECLEASTEFGIVWLSDDGLKDVGCSARVSRCSSASRTAG